MVSRSPVPSADGLPTIDSGSSSGSTSWGAAGLSESEDDWSVSRGLAIGGVVSLQFRIGRRISLTGCNRIEVIAIPISEINRDIN
jgi:hypothetical protein